MSASVIRACKPDELYRQLHGSEVCALSKVARSACWCPELATPQLTLAPAGAIISSSARVYNKAAKQIVGGRTFTTSDDVPVAECVD